MLKKFFQKYTFRFSSFGDVAFRDSSSITRAPARILEILWVYTKTQNVLIFSLGLMILGQIGFVCYRGHHSVQPVVQLVALSEETASNTTPITHHSHAGSAKAFGLALPHEKHFQVSSMKELSQIFKSCDYTLAKVKSEGKVPRLYLSKLPQGMRSQKTALNKTFIQVLLPPILKVNELILADRTRLLEMQARLKAGGHLRHSEKMWLAKIAADHRCKSTKIETLLTHVDVVPPSLALSQAILETGGGRSHAALNKNSPFGYMATKTKVKAFESLLHSVKAYVQNLNRHIAYASFRKERALHRAKNETPSGHKLAPMLVKYSVRGKAYTKDLQNLITNYGLSGYDHMTLDQQIRLKP